MDCSMSSSVTKSWSLLKLMSIALVMPSNHLILCHTFSSHLQSFSASGSFPISQYFASGGKSIGVSASASVLPMNIQDWYPLGLTGLISLQSKGLSRVFSNTKKASILRCWAFFIVQLSHPCMTTGKKHSLTRRTFDGKVMSLFMHWRRKWQPTPVFLPGESQGWQSLVGCCLWGRTELDTTEAT